MGTMFWIWYNTSIVQVEFLPTFMPNSKTTATETQVPEKDESIYANELDKQHSLYGNKGAVWSDKVHIYGP